MTSEQQQADDRVRGRTLAAAMQRALGSAIATDPVTATRLRKLAGDRLELMILPGRIHLHVHFVDAAEPVRIGPAADTEADEGGRHARIEASAGALLSVLAAEDRLAALHDPQLRIEGSVALVQAVGEALEDFRPDFTAWIAPLTGNTFAAAVGSGMSALEQVLPKLGGRMQDSVGDAAAKMLVTGADLRQFSTAVSELRSDVERLEARFEARFGALVQKHKHEQNQGSDGE